MAKKLSELAAEGKIKLPLTDETQSLKFKVLGQSLEGMPQGAVTVWYDDAAIQKQMNNVASTVYYKNTTIRSYLIGEFLNQLHEKVRECIIPTTVTALSGQSATETFEDPICMFSLKQLGRTSSGTPEEGAALSYFVSNTQRAYSEKYWTMTCYTANAGWYYFMESSGDPNITSFSITSQGTNSFAIRPYLNLNPDTPISDSPDADGYYTVLVIQGGGVNKKLSDAAPGTVVKIKEDGILTEFLVIKHGYPTSTNGRTLLLRKHLYDLRIWGNNSAYAGSSIDTWLTDTYFALLDPEIQKKITEVNIQYTIGAGNNTVTGLDRKVFLLSAAELGYSGSGANVEGEAIAYFDTNGKRVAFYNDGVALWWLRSASTSNFTVFYVGNTGEVKNGGNGASTGGSRPAFTVPSDLYITEDGEIAALGGGGNKKLSTASPGTIVTANYNGQPTNFVVLHQGKPSPIYDDSFNGGTIVRFEKIPENYQWTTTGTNDYAASGVKAHIQEYVQYFDNDIRAKIKTVKIPYRAGAGSSAEVSSGANGLECQMFLLSAAELGLTQGDVPVEGAKLDYYLAGTGAEALAKRIAYLGSAPARYNTRSPYVNAPATTNGIWEVFSSGNLQTIHSGSNFGALAAFVLDGETTYITEDGKLTTDPGVPDMLIPSSKLEEGVEYSIRAFPRSKHGQFQAAMEGSVVKATAGAPPVYGVKIDLNDSNPETSVTYTDAAVGFTPSNGGNGTFQDNGWSDRWPFSQIKPCLLKDGVVVGYLNPNDYTKFEDGSDADITSGNAGDVMVEFPKTWYKISKDASYLYVQISQGPQEGFTDWAFSYKGVVKDHFYIGAYPGYITNSKLRSISGKLVSKSEYFSTNRTRAQANGEGYELIPYNKLVLIQILYLIRFKNLNSQAALGKGYANEPGACGTLNTIGMYYGRADSDQHLTKCHGIENLWACKYWDIDGIFTSNNKIYVQDGNFDQNPANAIEVGDAVPTSIGYVSKVIGTNYGAFLVSEQDGSSTTYFCDSGKHGNGTVGMFGGLGRTLDEAGIFCMYTTRAFSNGSSSENCARLCYCG